MAFVVNPLINFTGDPIINNTLYFYDANGEYYTPGTISAVNWNFGDSYTSASPSTTNTYPHVYPISNLYNVILNVYDTSGNVASNSIQIPIVQNELSIEKDNLIELTGPGFTPRYGENKLINLTNFLPDVLKGTDTETFLGIFENFLNNMFPGYDGYNISAAEVPINKTLTSGTNSYYNQYSYTLPDTISADTVATDVQNLTINWPSNIYNQNQYISILEKIKRLTELQNIDLIDSEYIQFFANNLGYKINVNRGEITGGEFGNLSTIETQTGISTSATDSDKYLRFVIEQLPNWYKIKSTKDCIKVMLYSFGLIADLINYYTYDYDDYDISHWVDNYDNNISEIKNNYYPTPHFSVSVNIDKSVNYSFSSTFNTIVKAIESIKPITNVFEGLTAYMLRILPMIYAGSKIRYSRYIRIGMTSAIPSDFYRTHSINGNIIASPGLYGR